MKRATLPALAVLCLMCWNVWAQEGTPEDVLKRRLDRTKVSLRFRDAPLGQVLMTVAKNSRTSIVLDPRTRSAGKPIGDILVSVRVSDVSMKEFLEQVLEPLQLCFIIADGVVFVTDRWQVTTVMDPCIPKDTLAKLDKKLVTLQSGSLPLRQVTEFMARSAALNIRYDFRDKRRTKAPQTVFTVYDIPATKWFNWVARFENLAWTVENHTIIMTDQVKPEDFETRRRLRQTIVAFTFVNQPIIEALEYLGTVGSVNIVLDRRVLKNPQQTVTLRMINVTLAEAIREIARILGLRHAIRMGVVVITNEEGLKRPAIKRHHPFPTIRHHHPFLTDVPTQKCLEFKHKLEKKMVSFTFNNRPVMEVIKYFETLGIVNIVFDVSKLADPAQTITLKLINVPLDTALKLTAEQLGLCCVIRKEVIFISDKASIRRLRANVTGMTAVINRIKAAKLDDALAADDSRAVRQLEKTIVSFTFNKQAVYDALAYFETLGGVNIIPDRRKLKDGRTITLKLTNVSLRTAVTLLATQMGMHCTIRGGVIFISDKKGAQQWLAEAGDIPMAEADRKTQAGQAIRKQLMETKVTFNFEEQPLPRALDFLTKIIAVRIVGPLDAHKHKTVTLKVNQVPLGLGTAIKLLAEQAGLRYVVRNGVVVVSDEKTP